MALEMLKNGKGNCYRFAGLETMMAREGLTGQSLKAETAPPEDGTDIKLEL